MEESAEYWIHELKLQTHPEGGYFREVYRSEEAIQDLPSRYKGPRCFSTSIYFLLNGDQFSAFHKIKSDETWHFYTGCPLKLFTLREKTGFRSVKLGRNASEHEVLQYTIPHGTWFAARPLSENSYSLIGCTVSPGFEFDDFELATYEKLSVLFPEEREIIRKYCVNGE